MLYSLALATTLLAVSAAPVDTVNSLASRSTAGIVSLPVSIHKGARIDRNALRRRSADNAEIQSTSGSAVEPLENQIFQYVTTLGIGTPPQPVSVLVDTGSSDLWVYKSTTGENETFITGESSTFKDVQVNGFHISYVSGTVFGDWAQDSVALDPSGEAQVVGQRLAVVAAGADANTDVGIFGIGATARESSPFLYPNVPASLASAGIINRNAYSLYLNQLDADSGSIVFGGVDQAKFEPPLVTIATQAVNQFELQTSILGTTFSGLLDSGTSLVYLPQAVFDTIGQQLGATKDQGLYFLDNVPTDYILNFTFPGITISVPGTELVLDSIELGVDNPIKKYTVAVFPNSQAQGLNLLGDIFLRSAYVVFDVTNNEISLAQAKYTTDSDIIAIPATGAIPGSKVATAGQQSSTSSGNPLDWLTGLLGKLL